MYLYLLFMVSGSGVHRVLDQSRQKEKKRIHWKKTYHNLLSCRFSLRTANLLTVADLLRIPWAYICIIIYANYKPSYKYIQTLKKTNIMYIHYYHYTNITIISFRKVVLTDRGTDKWHWLLYSLDDAICSEKLRLYRHYHKRVISWVSTQYTFTYFV